MEDKIRADLEGKIRIDLEGKIRADLEGKMRNKMEVMRQEMKSILLDQMRLANSHIVPNRSHSVPSDNTLVPDASSARLASNNEIGLQQLSLNRQKFSHNRSHEIHQDVLQGKKQIDATMNKIHLQKKTKKKNQNCDLEVEEFVELLDYKGPKQVVARGILISKNRTKIVGGKELRNECWELLVKETLKPNESLLRPYDGVSNIGEAVGKTIAWRLFDIASKTGNHR